METTMRTRYTLVLAALLTLVVRGAAWGDDAVLLPYHADYSLALHGVSAGISRFSLVKTGDGRYTYSSSAHTTGLLGLIKPHYSVTQTSRFALADGRPQALEYSYDQSDGNDKSTETIHFDWSQAYAQGLDDGRKHRYALSPGMGDVFLIQLMLATDAAAGKLADQYVILDHSEASAYTLQKLPGEKVEVSGNNVDTLALALHNAKKGRTITVWLAPALHYLPVRIEQDKPAVSLTLNDISFDGVAPAATTKK
jgi:hypothetical protein